MDDSKKGKNDKDESDFKMGGFAFYLSMLAFLFICLSNLINLFELFDTQAFYNWLRFSVGIIVGVCFANLVGKSHLVVLMHELKHAAVSILAGNSPKGMKIEKSTGHFEYAYTKRTAHLNAMIALAPYWFPLLTLPAFLLYFTWFGEHQRLLIVIGITYGIDFITGLRDIGSHQSDLTAIRGGYRVGVVYITLAKLTFFTILCAWVCQSFGGLKHLMTGLWFSVMGIVAYFR